MIISCDYDEFKKAFQTYRGFKVINDTGEVKVFMTGDPPDDFLNASEYAGQCSSCVGLSSSVDSFVSDCKSRYGWYEDEYGRELFAPKADLPSLIAKVGKRKEEISSALVFFYEHALEMPNCEAVYLVDLLVSDNGAPLRIQLPYAMAYAKKHRV